MFVNGEYLPRLVSEAILIQNAIENAKLRRRPGNPSTIAFEYGVIHI